MVYDSVGVVSAIEFCHITDNILYDILTALTDNHCLFI